MPITVAGFLALGRQHLESHLMTQKFRRARAAARQNLTPRAFLTNGAEFAPLDQSTKLMAQCWMRWKRKALQERAH